jgi:GntR family transcriptional regulator
MPSRPVVPLYARLREHLRGEILRGRLKTHAKLPSEHALGAHHRVSRITVRQALRDLEAQGLIVKVHGKGAFVAPGRVSASLDRVEGLGESLGASGHAVANRRLAFRELPAPRAAARALGLRDRAPVVYLETLRTVDGAPFAVSRVWIRRELGRRLARLDLSTRDLLDVYERSLGVAIQRADDEVFARHPSAREARLLGVAVDLPCLEMRRTLIERAGAAIQLEVTLHRGDAYSYRVHPRRA